MWRNTLLTYIQDPSLRSALNAWANHRRRLVNILEADPTNQDLIGAPAFAVFVQDPPPNAWADYVAYTEQANAEGDFAAAEGCLVISNDAKVLLPYLARVEVLRPGPDLVKHAVIAAERFYRRAQVD